jgi:hypothetical protein
VVGDLHRGGAGRSGSELEGRLRRLRGHVHHEDERQAHQAQDQHPARKAAAGESLIKAASPDIPTHFPPRAKAVIWIFLSGGYSHMETFDPKPALNDYAGMTFDKTPFENPVDSPLHKKRFRSVPSEEVDIRDVYPTIFPMQVGWQKHGESGIEVTDWWPHLARCVDDICFVRNMWTTDNDHAAENQFHTGRHKLDESQPSFDLVVERVPNGQGAMPSFKDQLTEEEIRNVAAYVVESTSG